MDLNWCWLKCVSLPLAIDIALIHAVAGYLFIHMKVN